MWKVTIPTEIRNYFYFLSYSFHMSKIYIICNINITTLLFQYLVPVWWKVTILWMVSVCLQAIVMKKAGSRMGIVHPDSVCAACLGKFHHRLIRGDFQAMPRKHCICHFSQCQWVWINGGKKLYLHFKSRLSFQLWSHYSNYLWVWNRGGWQHLSNTTGFRYFWYCRSGKHWSVQYRFLRCRRRLRQ